MKDYEYGLIEKLLVNPESIKDVYGRIKPEMFTDELCKDAYVEIIRNYDKTGEIYDVRSLSPQLETETRPKEVVFEWMKSLMSLQTGIGSAKSYADGIEKDYKARRLREIFETSDLREGAIESTINDLLSEIEALKENKRRASSSLAEITKHNKDNYFKEHDNGIQTGIGSLDDILLGLGKGDVTIIGARPSVGKSALATQIITTVAKKGKRVGYFNLEMNDAQIYERIVSSISGIDLNRIRRAINFLNGEDEKYRKAVEEMEKYNNLEIFSGSFSANEIKHLCRNMDFDLVVVDYLQIVKPDKSYGNRVSEVGDISKTIKAIAMELKIPVIALSQLNRKKGATDEPEMNDLRESGDIEQDASTILFMWNIDEAGTYKGLKVEKNRQGTKGKMALMFDGAHMSFIPSTDDVDTLTKSIGAFKSIENECPW